MKVETRSQAHASGGDQEGKIMTRKQKAAESQQSPSSKKPKNDQEGTTTTDGKSSSSSDGGGDFEKEYQEFGKAVRQHLSVDKMREILKINDQEYNSLVSDEAVVTTCVDLLFFGPPDKCAMCNTNLKFDGKQYKCYGFFSEWSSCTFKTRNPPRKQEETKLPDSVLKSPVDDLLKKHQDPKKRPSQQAPIKPLTGMVFALSGRFSRTHQYWKKEIERHGGKVSNSVKGITCLVVNASERERGGTAKIAEATEERLPMVREEWLIDSIEKQEPQPIVDYDVSSDFVDIVEGKQTLMEKNSEAEVLEAVTGELKLYGKRAVYKDSNLRDQGGEIFEKDGIVYNCAFTLCDLGLGMNDYCIMQLIRVREGNLHLYYKKSRLGSDKDKDTEERLEEKGNVDDAIKEFVRMFEEITGNEFEPWEREKKIEKKRMSFFPVDMDIGVDARYGGLGHRQQGSAVMHCKLEPKVANFMKVLCSQGIYWYALKDMGINTPDMPTGMLTDVHLKRCEEVLLQFVQIVRSQKESGPKAEAVWSDFSQRWYNLLPCPRPSILRDYQELADHGVSAFESIRDINAASRLIGDMSGSTLDDPLSDCYAKLNCKISSLEKDSDDYKMIEKYFETTYEPIKIADLEFDGSIENIFAVESGASPSLDDMKNLPNKLLLWCGTRSSNLMRHLHQGFLPSACYLPVPGHMFGNAIVCSDAATEAARYAYSAVGRRAEGFLVLAVAAFGDHIVETKKPPEESVLNSWQQKKIGAKGLGRKKTDESEHFLWGENVKVPCGRLVASGHEDSLLEYNEYAVYDPKQTSVRFLVEVKFEEKGEVMQ